eukprot:SAG25_NODE_1245_length_3510_cov_1468.316431_3_plen_70_part_00
MHLSYIASAAPSHTARGRSIFLDSATIPWPMGERAAARTRCGAKIGGIDSSSTGPMFHGLEHLEFLALG